MERKTGNRFANDDSTIEVYGIECPDRESRVTCVDVRQGFMFMLSPTELMRKLDEFGYTFVDMGETL